MINNYFLTFKQFHFMAKENFRNGAVIRNEQGEFLCTTNGHEVFWSNSTEHAFCFPTNNEAERWLNEWNDNHRFNRDMILNGVRIEESNCMCGETHTPVGAKRVTTRRASCGCADVNVSDDMVVAAMNILRADEADIDELTELSEAKESLEAEKEELEDALKENASELAEATRRLNAIKSKINRKLDTVFTPAAKEAILKHLVDL